MLLPGTDYSSMGSGPNYLVSIWELAYVRTHQQIAFMWLNRFCLLSKTLPPPPVINEHNQAQGSKKKI